MNKAECVVLASTNKGKINEFSALLLPFGVTVLGLDDFPEIAEIEETGSSFAENAFIKASTVALKTGLVSLADDSGLEVAALHGAPGIFSARFSATDTEKATTEKNNAKLLSALQGVPIKKRLARFVCAISACAPQQMGQDYSANESKRCISPNLGDKGNTSAHTQSGFDKINSAISQISARGIWDGYITENLTGNEGFGYDPLFLDPELGLTAAQMTAEEKNHRSHRAKAVAELLTAWPAFWEAWLAGLRIC